MFKKITIFLTVAIMAIVSIFLFGEQEVFADTPEVVGEISSMQVSANSLGLPATLDYDFTRSNVNTSSDFTVNGITYTVSDGQITAASAPSNASEITTIGFLDSVNLCFSLGCISVLEVKVKPFCGINVRLHFVYN